MVDASQWTPFNQYKAETITFGGVTWTGAFTYRLDRVETYKSTSPEGMTGSTAKYLGQEEREIQIEAIITTPDEYVLWMEIAEVVFAPPTRGGAARTVYVVHPELNQYYSIFEVNLVRCTNPQPDGTLNRRKATMTLREQAPPRVTQTKIGGANPDNQKKQDPQLSPELQALNADIDAAYSGTTRDRAEINQLHEVHRTNVDASADNNP